MPPSPYFVDFQVFYPLCETHEFPGLRNIATVYTAKRHTYAPIFPLNLLFPDHLTPILPKKGRTQRQET